MESLPAFISMRSSKIFSLAPCGKNVVCAFAEKKRNKSELLNSVCLNCMKLSLQNQIMQKYLIKNIHVVNEGSIQAMDVLMANERIEKIAPNITVQGAVQEINGDGKYLLPGAIDDQ